MALHFAHIALGPQVFLGVSAALSSLLLCSVLVLPSPSSKGQLTRLSDSRPGFFSESIHPSIQCSVPELQKRILLGGVCRMLPLSVKTEKRAFPGIEGGPK